MTVPQAIHFMRIDVTTKLMAEMGPIADELPTRYIQKDIIKMIKNPRKHETEAYVIEKAIEFAANDEKQGKEHSSL